MIPFLPIRELAVQVRGVSYAKQDAFTTAGDGRVAILRAGNIRDADLVLDDLVYVPRKCVAEGQMLRRHDVLVATSSGSLDVVGKAAQSRSDLGVAFGAFCKVLRPKASIEPRYFAHYFRTAEYRRTISKLAAGANINNLRNEHLDDLLIPVPPMPEQRRIADILDKADAIRRKRKEAIALTEALLRSTFLAMFGDPATNPKGWPDATIDDLCSTIVDCPHTTPTYDGDERPHPCVRTSDLQGGFFDWASTKHVSAQEYRERVARLTPIAGDVFYTREGERYGIAAILPEGVSACLGQRMMLLRADNTITTPEFLWALMNSSAVYRQATSEVGGSTSPHVNVKSIRRFRAVRPPLALQREYSRIFQLTDRNRLQKIKALEAAEGLLASLMHSVFSHSTNKSLDVALS